MSPVFCRSQRKTKVCGTSLYSGICFYQPESLLPFLFFFAIPCLGKISTVVERQWLAAFQESAAHAENVAALVSSALSFKRYFKITKGLEKVTEYRERPKKVREVTKRKIDHYNAFN